jgi:peptidyl-prolyl cis-trans isomerase B (cyclophilin B)
MSTIASPRTNVLSIVSLVTGIIGLAIIPVILGHISLSQIKKSGEQGRVLAIIGLVLGYIGIAGYVLVLLLGVTGLVIGGS